MFPAFVLVVEVCNKNSRQLYHIEHKLANVYFFNDSAGDKSKFWRIHLILEEIMIS